MSPDTLLGLFSGGLLGAATATASYVLYRVARARAEAVFYRLVLGGMLARLAMVLALVALVVRLAPFDVSAFIGALFVAFALGLAIDIALIARHPARVDA